MPDVGAFVEVGVTPNATIEMIIKQQLEVMSQQLKVLSGNRMTEQVSLSNNEFLQSAHRPPESNTYFPQGSQQNQADAAGSFYPKLEIQQTASKSSVTRVGLQTKETQPKSLNPIQQ